VSRVTNDDRLFGYRLQLFDLARRTSVSEACRTFGVHPSTYYAWKRRVERHGPEILRPRERRAPKMPNQLPAMVEERILSFAIAHPGLGPRRVASELARQKWGGLVVSHASVWRVLRRHGLSRRRERFSLVAGYAAPYEPPRQPQEERHVDAERPGELVGMDCCFVGRLSGTKGAVWQLTAIDVRSSYAWAELVRCPKGQPTGEQTSRLARRVAYELSEAGWRLERVLSDNGGEFRSRDFESTLERLGAIHSRIHAGRPQTNGNVEALQRTILEDCWRPAFARFLHLRYTGLRRELETYLRYYNFDRVHHGRLTAGAFPQRWSTVPARWRRDEPPVSAHLGGGAA
jgi:transposase InsO family protein